MDYRVYRFHGKEMAENVVCFLALDGMISLLFYRSWIAFLVGLPLIRLFFRERKRTRIKARQERLAGQFLMAMQAVTTSLTAGYAVETAFVQALGELEELYGKEELISVEFRGIVGQLQVNRNLEELLEDLAVRSGIEDIRNFAELFSSAKRSGGNLIAMIRNTAQAIGKKDETRKEIQATLSAKKLEQRMMSVIPCLILVYVQTVSPGFLDNMYHNAAGIAVMTAALAVYGAAVIWGSRIVDIEV